jgi:hypothetical protein
VLSELFDSVVSTVLVRYAPGRVGEEPDNKDTLKDACVCVGLLPLGLLLILVLVPVVEVCA